MYIAFWKTKLGTWVRLYWYRGGVRGLGWYGVVGVARLFYVGTG